jgi:hypothetical protein
LIIFYVVYAGISGNVNWKAWTAIGIVLAEGLILAFNKAACPLTDIAARYTDHRSPNFDIFLPLWLARYNKQIYTTIFAVGLIIVIVRS